MLYKHTHARLFCDARPRLHVIRNNVEKVKLDVDRSTKSVQVERANTKSNAIYKKKELQFNEFTR